ncbi:MAG TPA: class I SAM-dependent methyltransferase, partial [Vicinamibacterales bacterium]|nr:class I SAM-dependent methyltransferase [Vicinamibacterales bacterium]
ALARDAARSNRVARRAETRGVFLEHGLIAEPLPHANEQFDLVIADDRVRPGSLTGAALLAEALRVLRPGGRIIVLRSYRRWPWSRGESPDRVLADLLKALLDAGFRAAREIGAREGISFAEAARSA